MMKTSSIHPIRRRALAVGLVVALFAGAGGALASLVSGSDYADPEVVQLGYGPGGPPSADVSPSRRTTKEDSGRAYGSAEIIQLGFGPGGPPASERQ